MKNSLFNSLLSLILLYVICQLGLFLFYQFYLPELGDITITITPNNLSPEIQEVNLSLSRTFDKYYLLIYEEHTEDTWIYFNTKIHDKSSELLISEFLPHSKSKYILLEGTKLQNTFNFKMKSKYPISYMSNKDSKFHLFYIVPYKFFPFPTFYYSKHFVFFVDPII